MKKYLLPCSCGQKVAVDASQAGLEVPCACGAKLEVPTMRGLSQLQIVEEPREEHAAPQAAWGPAQGLMFLGAVLLLGGLVAVLLVMQTRPQWQVQDEQIRLDVNRLTPGQLWQRWQFLRQGVGGPNDPIRQQYEQAWSTYRRRLTMSILPLAAGVLLFAAGFAMFRARKHPTSPPRGRS